MVLPREEHQQTSMVTLMIAVTIKTCPAAFLDEDRGNRREGETLLAALEGDPVANEEDRELKNTDYLPQQKDHGFDYCQHIRAHQLIIH